MVHLAASGNAPEVFYPIIIDQDRNNGNVKRCLNTIKAYQKLAELAGKSRGWFFRSTLVVQEKLLPLVPQELNENYRAAIGYPSMAPSEQLVVESLFSTAQLDEHLDSGYKKRAHMGSILMRKMFEQQELKEARLGELTSVVEKVKNISDALVIIIGSLFGGTGASGLVNAGEYFRKNLPNATVVGVFLTPYFLVGKGEENDKDANLVRSDSDMQAVKTFLQMYKPRIEEAFHDVFIIGSEIKRLAGEFPTEKARYGGINQENPSHVFELFAAAVGNVVPPKDKNTFHYWIYAAAKTPKRTPPLSFVALAQDLQSFAEDAPMEIGLDDKCVLIARDFADMICTIQDNQPDWWERQPWAHPEFRAPLYNWARRYINWWNEMAPEGLDGHRWSIYNLRSRRRIPTYRMVSYLSRHFGSASSAQLASLFETVNRLAKVKLKEAKWASL